MKNGIVVHLPRFPRSRNRMSSKDEEALELARKHYEIEPGMTRIFRLTGSAEVESRPNEPIKLLEINENTVPSGIMPIWFGPFPAAGLHHSSIILEVTPDEFDKIQERRLELPNGWQLADLIPKATEAELL
jgi:hypothetical protein